jgi:hypothetical protein
MLAAGLAVIVALHLVTLPDDERLTICQMRRVTGLPCPTCGITRSLSMLTKGEWRRACAYHPLGPVVAALLVGGWFYAIACSARGRAPQMPRNRVVLVGIAVFGAASIAIWIARYILPLFLHHHGGL